MNEKDKRKSGIKDKYGALNFLTEHPVIPHTDDIPDEEWELYYEVMDYIGEHPDHDFIPLILGSYRGDSDTYISEAFGKLLAEHDWKAANEHITAILKSDDIVLKESVLFFAGEVATDDLIGILIEILRDENSTDNMVKETVSILETLQTPDNYSDLQEIIKKEFRQNTRWKSIVEYLDAGEFQSLLRSINWKARIALEEKNYSEVIELLGPYDGKLPKVAQEKLDIAKKYLVAL